MRRSERAEARRAQREREEEQGRVHRLIERERVYQRQKVRVVRRDAATGEPRATWVRTGQASPTGIDGGDTSWAVMSGRVAVFHRY